MSEKGKELTERLIHPGMRGKEEWLAFEKEVRDFLKNEATPEDKKLLGQYTESLYMICRGFEYSEQQKAGQEEKRGTEGKR